MNIKPIFEPFENITLKDYMKKCGIENIEEYMSARYIEPLDHYDNIYEMAQVILDAINKNRIFYLIHDSDNDGAFACAVQYIYLKRCRPNLNVKVLIHDKNPKAHGLHDDEIMERLIQEASGIEGINSNEGLIWISDAGSNNTEECKILSELGYTCCISDHHEFSQDNPYAIIVNNQYSKNVINKQLSGCGVTFKVCQAIDELNNTTYANDLMSFVHLTNISDSCEFTNSEQNTFRYWGLQLMHPHLQPFIDAFNYQGGTNNKDFSFGEVSRINAVIRVGTLEEKQKLFMALACGQNVDEVIKICKKCKTEQDKLRDSLLENNLSLCLNSSIMVFKINIKTPLTGLIANKLMSKYNKPIFLVHERTEGTVEGSARSPIDIRSLCNESGLFMYAAGHEGAFGIGWDKEKEEEVFNWITSLTLSEPQISVLTSSTIKSLPKRLFNEFDPNMQGAHSIYGQGISEPLLHIHDIIFSPKDIQILGSNKRTLKLEKDGIAFMWFMVSNADKELLTTGLDKKMEVVGTMNINEWNGYRTPQLIIDKFEVENYEKTIDSIF